MRRGRIPEAKLGELLPLDSMALVVLCVEIERRIAPVPEQELSDENFQSIATIVAMIDRLRPRP